MSASIAPNRLSDDCLSFVNSSAIRAHTKPPTQRLKKRENPRVDLEETPNEMVEKDTGVSVKIEQSQETAICSCFQ